MDVKYIDIGGGSGSYIVDEWLNLDEFSSVPFILNEKCVFPVGDNTINLIWTSHTLEHLNDETVSRVLDESYRVLETGGNFVIKLPDFDNVLEQWRNRNIAYFNLWDYQDGYWKNRNVEGTIENKVAMIFCSFSNNECGKLFSIKENEQQGAYIGPPIIDHNTLVQILNSNSPHQISVELRNIVIESEDGNYNFIHQNAWSKLELEQLIVNHGFHVRSFNMNDIFVGCVVIPKWKFYEVSEISFYCWAKK
jgi:predicted SAM-dependent methyltransferase